MKQEFEMTQGVMDGILEINKTTEPVMQIGTVTTGMDKQKRINDYWDTLSKKYGFKPDTVEGSSRGTLFFLAEPAPTEDEIHEKQLADDLARGQKFATKLIEHVIDIGAASSKIPITHKGDIWNVTVECITASVKDGDCPVCESPLEDNGKCSDVGDNNCQYQK